MSLIKNIITSKQKIIEFLEGSPEFLRNTETIYVEVLDFYLQVIQNHVDLIPTWSKETGQQFLEKQTIQTKPRVKKATGELYGGNSNPPHPIDAAVPKFPAYLRRAIITKAIGMAQSWYSNYQRWLKKKGKHNQNNEKRIQLGKHAIKFIEHPPKYPTAGKVGITYYKGEFKELNIIKNTMKIKVWDGKDWRFITVKTDTNLHVQRLHHSDEWEMTVPTIKEKNGAFHVTTAFEKKTNVMKFTDYYQKENPMVMAIDLNLGTKNRAVCSLVDKQGTVHKVKHISLKGCNTTDVHHKLGLISRNIRKLKLIPKGQNTCKDLWRKVNNINDNYAHHLSKEIVDLAKAWGVKVIVFENLTHFRPEKTKKSSKNLRKKIMYWLHRRVMNYTEYKAKAQGILIAKISPKNTSRTCSICGSLNTTRSNNNTLKCECGKIHNSHINASINIGNRWFFREEKRLSKSA